MSIIDIIHNDMRQIKGEAAEAAKDADSITDQYKKADHLWEYANRALDHDDLSAEEYSKLEYIAGKLKDVVQEGRNKGFLRTPSGFFCIDGGPQTVVIDDERGRMVEKAFKAKAAKSPVIKIDN